LSRRITTLRNPADWMTKLPGYESDWPIYETRPPNANTGATRYPPPLNESTQKERNSSAHGYASGSKTCERPLLPDPSQLRRRGVACLGICEDKPSTRHLTRLGPNDCSIPILLLPREGSILPTKTAIFPGTG